jgi:hypothetical protein
MRVKIRGTRYVLDREWFCRWFLGRRVWLTLGLMFHGNLQVLMNIGMFPPIMMSTYLFCLRATSRAGSSASSGAAWPASACRCPPRARRGELPPLPAEDRTLPHHLRDGRAAPAAPLRAARARRVRRGPAGRPPGAVDQGRNLLGYDGRPRPAAATACTSAGPSSRSP